MKLSERIATMQATRDQQTARNQAEARYFQLLLKDDPADADEVLKLGQTLGRDAAGIADDQQKAVAFASTSGQTAAPARQPVGFLQMAGGSQPPQPAAPAGRPAADFLRMGLHNGQAQFASAMGAELQALNNAPPVLPAKK